MFSSLNLLTKNEYVIRTLIPFALSWFLIYFSLPFLKKYFPDKPNRRSSHNVIKARAGGISFILVSLLFFLVDKNYEILICFIFDKIYSCSFIIRNFLSATVNLFLREKYKAK